MNDIFPYYTICKILYPYAEDADIKCTKGTPVVRCEEWTPCYRKARYLMVSYIDINPLIPSPMRGVEADTSSLMRDVDYITQEQARGIYAPDRMYPLCDLCSSAETTAFIQPDNPVVYLRDHTSSVLASVAGLIVRRYGDESPLAFMAHVSNDPLIDIVEQARERRIQTDIQHLTGDFYAQFTGMTSWIQSGRAARFMRKHGVPSMSEAGENWEKLSHSEQERRTAQ